jgi:hypothetical protein
MKHSTDPSTGRDIDALIREAEHAVIASDAHFSRCANDLGAALRGHAGRVIAGSITGVAVALVGWLLYRTRSTRREAAALRRGAPARPIPLQPRGAAAVLGAVLGSAAGAADQRRAAAGARLAAPRESTRPRRGPARPVNRSAPIADAGAGACAPMSWHIDC